MMLTVDEARARVMAMASPRPAATVPLGEAAGLVLAQQVTAGRDLPGFDNSAMDGFAVRAADLAGASAGTPVRLRLIGEVAAGSTFAGRVEAGTAVRIMTGAPVPAGADAVVEVEEATVEGDSVLLRLEPGPGRSFRLAGSDVRAGESALAPGIFLGPAQVALLAALGEVHPVCVPRPVIALVSTGDELVDADQEPGPGQVVDAVGPGLAAAVTAAGGIAMRVARARDTPEDVRRALSEAAAADVVVSVGGVSMGQYDLVRDGVAELGELDFWKVAVRPGKPLAVGRVMGKPFLGLPGNPVSALVGFEVYVLPLLLALSGRPGWARPWVEAELGAPISTPSGLRTFARATLQARPGAAPLAHPLTGQGSHQLRSLATSSVLLDIPEDGGDLGPGARVRALLIEHPPAPSH